MKANRFLAVGLVASSLFTSPGGMAETLEAVISKALKENPQAIASLSRYRAETENVNIAWGSFLPSLDVSAAYGKQQRDYPEPEEGEPQNATSGITYTRKEGSVSFRQNVFSGFNTLNSVRQARYRARAEYLRLQSTLQDLGLQITDAYMKVLERRELLKLAEDNLEVHNTIYEQIEQRALQGVSRSSDLTQIEGRKARASANVVTARNNLQDAESEYLALVGSLPGELDPPEPDRLALPASVEHALQSAIKNHPGILAADLDIKSAESNYSAQLSSFYPTLDLELDQNWRHNVDSQEGTIQDSTAMVRMRYNLFRGGSDRARVKESAYRVEETRAQRDRTLRQIEESLRMAWSAHEFAQAQRTFLHQHEASSRETVDAYREQFNIGKRTLLDLLDSENELFQASENYTRSVYQEAFARYRVASSTGALLEQILSATED